MSAHVRTDWGKNGYAYTLFLLQKRLFFSSSFSKIAYYNITGFRKPRLKMNSERRSASPAAAAASTSSTATATATAADATAPTTEPEW